MVRRQTTKCIDRQTVRGFIRSLRRHRRPGSCVIRILLLLDGERCRLTRPGDDASYHREPSSLPGTLFADDRATSTSTTVRHRGRTADRIQVSRAREEARQCRAWLVTRDGRSAIIGFLTACGCGGAVPLFIADWAVATLNVVTVHCQCPDLQRFHAILCRAYSVTGLAGGAAAGFGFGRSRWHAAVRQSHR